MIYQSEPSMVSRSGWGARSATNNLVNLGSKQYIVIHHAGDANDNIVKVYPDEKAAMKRYQEIHMDSNGWADIGYHYCVGIKGTILQERNDTKEGVHTPGYNYCSIAVMIHGNYDIRSLTSTQKSKLVSLLAWLCYTNNISPSKIYGHGDLASSSCPGSSVKSQLSSIRGLVMNKLYPQPEN